MPRAAKGARLIWRKESVRKDGSIRSPAGYWIRDGKNLFSTGCSQGETDLAQQKLSEHITKKLKTLEPERKRGNHPDHVIVADVVSAYLDDKVPSQASPKAAKSRLNNILDFFGGKYVSDINGKICRAYAEQRTTRAAARRELEDLRSALKHYKKEGWVTYAPDIVLPAKSESRVRYLSRSEAARLLWAAWRMRQTWKGQPSDRRTGQHIARFILVGLYTGTRSAAICGAALRPTVGRGYVDLNRGVFHRKSEGVRETKKRQPPVKLPDRLLAHIRRWSKTPVNIKTKARGKSKTIGRMVAHDFVVEWQGRPVSDVHKSFLSAVTAAGLESDVTPHVLRHTAATWLMINGTSLSEAADFLGMTEAVLRSTYFHHHPDFQADAATNIAAKQKRNAR